MKAGGTIPNPGGAARLIPLIGGDAMGVEALGVDALGTDHGAGDLDRTALLEVRGEAAGGFFESRCLHNTASMASSRGRPSREVSLRSNSSNFSVLSSSSSPASSRMG